MSDSTTAPGTAAETPAIAPASNEAAPKAVVDDKGDPLWLGDRINRAQKAALREAGIKVGKNEDPKKVLKDINEKSASRKERLSAANKTIAERDVEIASLRLKAAVVDVAAKAELETLDEKTRAAIKVVAGDDAQKILETISLFKMTGRTASAEATPAAATPAAATAPAAAATPVVAPPASTSPNSPAPTPSPLSEVDTRQQYANIQNPYVRAAFILNHPELVPGLLNNT